jgi:sugar phosphate isomerase/epimerase
MKVGYETIIWGPYVDNLKRVLDVIAAAGYQGVEFAQHPETLGDVRELLRLLQERDLTLLGLTIGSSGYALDSRSPNI